MRSSEISINFVTEKFWILVQLFFLKFLFVLVLFPLLVEAVVLKKQVLVERTKLKLVLIVKSTQYNLEVTKTKSNMNLHWVWNRNETISVTNLSIVWSDKRWIIIKQYVEDVNRIDTNCFVQMSHCRSHIDYPQQYKGLHRILSKQKWTREHFFNVNVLFLILIFWDIRTLDVKIFKHYCIVQSQ